VENPTFFLIYHPSISCGFLFIQIQGYTNKNHLSGQTSTTNPIFDQAKFWVYFFPIPFQFFLVTPIQPPDLFCFLEQKLTEAISFQA